MLAPISSSRRDKGSSFKKLKEYLLLGRDPETGEEMFRGEFILSANLLSLHTADFEMKGIAAQNVLCKDAIYHYQIAWRPGEHPTREQWQISALKTLQDLGFAGHQYLIVAHDDKAHFHVHVMVNKVHPETYRAHSPFYDMPTLDKAMRELEHEQGWKEAVGHYRWDKEKGVAVKNTREEMWKLSQRKEQAAGKAAEVEFYRDEQSLQAYVKGKPAADLTKLLQGDGVSWFDVHRMLSSHGLEIQKAEHGGYTVHAIDSELYVKASTVFRNAFSGKKNREETEKKLGAWRDPSTEDRQFAGPREKYEKRSVRDPHEREEQRERKQQAREGLKQRYGAYRNGCHQHQRQYTASVGQRRVAMCAALKESKRTIRDGQISWQEKRAQLSRVVAEHVAQMRLLKVEAMRERLALGGMSYQEWVMRSAADGDEAAIAQRRGWHYQDGRRARTAHNSVAGTQNVAHFSAGTASEETAWKTLPCDRLLDLRHTEQLAKTIAAIRWTVDRRTGNVHYTLGGTPALIDKGKEVSVLTAEEPAVVLALEMAMKKYGMCIAATGAEEWRWTIAKVAARNEIAVKFTDPQMQRWVVEEQMRLGVPVVWEKHYARLAASMRTAGSVALGDRATTCVFLESLYGSSAGKGLSDNLDKGLRAAGKMRENLKGICELEMAKDAVGKISYELHSHPGRESMVAELLEKAGKQAPQIMRIAGHVQSRQLKERVKNKVQELES